MISAPERSYTPPDDDGLLLDLSPNLVHVSLNRPQALNALSHAMIKGLWAILDANPSICILVSGVGRAFCAGGDIKAQAHAIKTHDKATPAGYFKDEYGLNERLFNHKGPYVSYLNGIVMGGGYGVSAHGSHLVTSEATQFAMPEVKIGFFPDIGATWHLARVPNQLGTYMALTGNTVGVADMHYMKLAHAHIPHAQFEALKKALQAQTPEEALASLHTPFADDSILKRNEDVIARCFAFDSAEAIVDALKTDGSGFAVQTVMEIEQRSPTSVKVALAHIRRAAREEFSTVIARDLDMALKFLDAPDFPEGVRAAIIDKDRNPRWNPPSLAQVDAARVALYLGSGAD